MSEMKPGEDMAFVVEEVIKHRRSCRQMLKKRIPRATLERLVAAATWAPTGSNHQNVRFILLETPERMITLGKLKAPRSVVSQASAGILVMTDTAVKLKHGEEHIWCGLWPQNAAAAIQNILLLATAMGLATCWISFLECMSGTRLTAGKRWRELFPEYKVPDNLRVQGLVVLGMPAQLDHGGFPVGDESHGGRLVKRSQVKTYLLESL